MEPLEGRALLATVTVSVQDFSFNPDPVTIHPGDTVHWVWMGNDHSVTSVSKTVESFDSGVHNTGFTFDHTYMQTGSFQYYCVIHGQLVNGKAIGMAGTINVTPAAGAATLQSINVTPANPSLGIGNTQAFTATGTFSDNSTQNLTSQVTWASATPSVATITSTGLATGVATGTSTISANMNGVTGSTTLTVSTSSTSPTPTPTPTPTPAPILSSEMRVFTGKGAKRKLSGVNLFFSTALQINVAQDITHYHITQPGRTKKARPVNVPVRIAMYNPSNDSVMLTLGKFSAGKPLTLTATGLVGFAGTPAATITTKL